MNKIIISGRITRDLELKYTESNVAMLKFNVAVNRNFKNANGEYEADFINCLAFRNNAEFISKYFQKGSGIILEGKIQTGSYEKEDGTKIYTTDLVVDHSEFLGSKKDNEDTQAEEEIDIEKILDENDFLD